VAALVSLGHRQIGFLHWRYPAGGHWGSHRYAAYAAALAAQGLDLNPDHVLNIHASAPDYPTPAAIAARVAALSRKKSGPTAWICAADHQAFALAADLAPLGIQVPRDLSLAGFDGQATPAGLPAIATDRVPYEDIGASSVARLISRMLEPTSPRRVIHVDPAWDAGASLAKPRT
jgi:LacI family transcriptional regulator